MGFLFSPLGEALLLSHSDELVPPLDVDDRDLCRRRCLPRVPSGDVVLGKPCLFFESTDEVRCGGVCGGTFGWGRNTRRAREPRTPLRGEKIVAGRCDSAVTEPNVLEDQRLRNRSVDSNSGPSGQGEFEKENGEMGVFEEDEDAKDKVESMEERGASESVLERGSVTWLHIAEIGVSGIAGGSGWMLAEAMQAKEDRE